MPKKKISSLRCPSCRKLVLRDEPEFPFCSERCRMIDFGKWASGGYVISTPLDWGEEGGEAGYSHRPGERAQRNTGIPEDDQSDNDRRRQ